MIGQMAIAIALLGFNDLGCSVTPSFLFRNIFYLQLSPHCPKMNKKSMWEVKKFSRFLSNLLFSNQARALNGAIFHRLRDTRAFLLLKDGAYYCYCAYVLRISRYSDFLSVMLTNTGIFLRGLKLSGESRS